MTGLRFSPAAPSSPFDAQSVERGLDLLKNQRFTQLGEARLRAFEPNYLNGSDAERTKELEAALFEASCDLIWMARGGYGLTRILPSLKLPKTKLPVVLGFSDVTALHCHLWTQRKHKGIHSSNLMRLADESADSLGILWSILEGGARDVHYPTLRTLFAPPALDVQGTLIVANLCVLTALIGTPSMPQLAGCILVIEEIGERPYRIDRMLTQLWYSGSLQGVQAIVMGQLTSCEEPDQSVTAEQVIAERCQHFTIPLYAGLPVGHDIPNWAIPFGTLASLKAAGDNAQLRILEELF
jgi:muramoyltetrapeptide carboxypeptidase